MHRADSQTLLQWRHTQFAIAWKPPPTTKISSATSPTGKTVAISTRAPDLTFPRAHRITPMIIATVTVAPTTIQTGTKSRTYCDRCSVGVGYVVNLIDKKVHFTDWVASKLREAAALYEKNMPTDYNPYSPMFGGMP